MMAFRKEGRRQKEHSSASIAPAANTWDGSAPSRPGWPDPLPERLAWMQDYIERVAFTRAEVLGLWNKAAVSANDALLPAMSTDGVLRSAYDAGRIAAAAVLASRQMRIRSKGSHHQYTFSAVGSLDIPGLNDIIVDSEEVRGLRADSEYGAQPASAADRDLARAWMKQTLPLLRASLVAGDPELASRLSPVPN
jgi:hypothetical protein